MKILHFLKSSIGAISKAGLYSTATVGLLGGLSLYNYVTSSPAVQDQKVRSLANIIASGGEMPSQYSGINVSRGQAEFATAEERAAREGTLFDGGDSAVAALDGIGVGSNGMVEGIGTIEGRALGAGEAGLGMGANNAMEIAGGGRAAHGAQRGDVSGVDAAAQGAAEKEASGKTLQRASVARASGGSGSASFSGSNGGFGASGSAGRTAAQEKASRINPSSVGANSISGAMPGRPLIAANQNIRGAGSTTFAGGSRRGRVGSGTESEEGKDLRRIAVQSGKVAANAHRAANEGTSPFMADQQLAAGITLDDGTMTGTAFGAKSDGSKHAELMDQQIDDAVQALEDTGLEEAERKSQRSALAKEVVALCLASIIACFAIAAVKDIPEYGQIVAGIITAAMMIWIATFIVRTGLYMAKYDGAKNIEGWVFIVLAAGCVAAVGAGWSNAAKQTTEKLMEKIGTKLGTKAIGEAGKEGFVSVAQQTGQQLGGMAIGQVGTGMLGGGEGLINDAKGFAEGQGNGGTGGTGNKK